MAIFREQRAEERWERDRVDNSFKKLHEGTILCLEVCSFFADCMDCSLFVTLHVSELYKRVPDVLKPTSSTYIA